MSAEGFVAKRSEKQFLEAVIRTARLFGWRHYHCFDSRRSDPGYPDLCLLRPPRFILSELKSDKGKPTEHQAKWLDELKQVPGIEVYLWTPDQWDTVIEVLK